MNRYLHGVYGNLGESQNVIAEKSQTVATYVGTLPVHLMADYSELINKPIRLNNYVSAIKTVGHLEDFENFTLCEAVDAHFLNEVKPIGPIIVINVLDPKTMRGETEKSSKVVFSSGSALLTNNKAILNTIKIADKEQGVDYLIEYSTQQKGFVFIDLKGTMIGEIDISYFEIEPTKVSEADIIGVSSETGKTGIQAISNIYTSFGIVPSLLLAPKWSKEKNVQEALVGKSYKLNGKFYSFVLMDLPASYKSGEQTIEVDSIAKAVNARTFLGLADEKSKVSWPMGEKKSISETKRYHISTLTAVVIQQTDNEHGGVPYESPSNKSVDINGYYLENKLVPLYDEEEVNELNANGITTIVNRGGQWRLWGPHTAAYEENGGIDPRAVFDSSMRMLFYLINEFIIRNGDLIDTPLSKNMIDAILNSENSLLDAYISSGYLLFGEISFDEFADGSNDFIEGDFIFNFAVTTTPVIKSITGNLSYTNAGILALANITRGDAQ